MVEYLEVTMAPGEQDFGEFPRKFVCVKSGTWACRPRDAVRSGGKPLGLWSLTFEYQ